MGRTNVPSAVLGVLKVCRRWICEAVKREKNPVAEHAQPKNAGFPGSFLFYPRIKIKLLHVPLRGADAEVRLGLASASSTPLENTRREVYR